MIRINHILKELFRNIFRNPGTAFGALLSLTLLFLLFDIFWVAAGTSEQFYDDLLYDLQMEVFIAEDAEEISLSQTKEVLLRIEGIRSVTYVSKDAARQQLIDLIGVDLLVGYDSLNPLPRSWQLTFASEYQTRERLDAIEREINTFEDVSHVQYSRNWLEKAERTKSMILNIGMVLGLLILLTALFNSANNIRLMARARAVGFYQMRLIGAGKLFLALPFMLEGFLMSGISAAAGWGLLYYWKGKIEFTWLEIIFPAADDIIMFCLATAVLGVISGYFGIRRLLKV